MGLEVLDLSVGIAGSMSAMLLSDHGASVTKLEPPGGDPFRSLSGFRVWNRGKRSAVLDLEEPTDRDRLLSLSRSADVLIESFSPGVTQRLGIDFDTIHAKNPRLIYCSITGYGSEGPDAERPAYDALVAARTGHQWESRGVVGGTIAKLSGSQPIGADCDPPVDQWAGPPREGPTFSQVPWPSVAACEIATLAVSAALRARELTGRGQHIETSLLQGVLATTVGAWHRVERLDGYETLIIDPRWPRGFFQCSDGRWIHNWAPLPGFLLAVSEGDKLRFSDDMRARFAQDFVGMGPEALQASHEMLPRLQDAVRRFPSQEWEQVALEAGPSVQTIRSPEEALQDPALLADGCVAEVADPELGPVRQVGLVYELRACPSVVKGPAPKVGQHTAEVAAKADRLSGQAPSPARAPHTGRSLGSPLEGVLVLDLGIAVAGPFGAQLLAEMGAEVIKVHATNHKINLPGHMHTICERSKRSIALDLKNPEGRAIFQRLVERADVVHTNMRYDAVQRLDIEYDALREMNPRIIFCHTRGHDRGPRQNVTGHDQSGAALAGTTWVEGGLDDAGRPHWPTTSLGDLGNGFLSAIAVSQALYHRERTGEGQQVDTAIVNAHLLNCSSAWLTPDGEQVAQRPQLDAMVMGWNALYRLYRSADEGWLCLVVPGDAEWQRLCDALERPDLSADPRFADAAQRRENDVALAATLEPLFASRSAQAWFERLDAAGVPCEISSSDYVLGLFDDPTALEKQWVTTVSDPVWGRIKQCGLLADLSDTPQKIWGPAAVVGSETTPILRWLGYAEPEIANFVDRGIVVQTSAEHQKV
jgi:crotonobetainyl-CoA:carnitine CoA-transferase CaiB-like acyl-CoA transferase